jgi:hypothetical protein
VYPSVPRAPPLHIVIPQTHRPYHEDIAVVYLLIRVKLTIVEKYFRVSQSNDLGFTLRSFSDLQGQVARCEG